MCNSKEGENCWIWNHSVVQITGRVSCLGRMLRQYGLIHFQMELSLQNHRRAVNLISQLTKPHFKASCLRILFQNRFTRGSTKPNKTFLGKNYVRKGIKIPTTEDYFNNHQVKVLCDTRVLAEEMYWEKQWQLYFRDNAKKKRCRCSESSLMFWEWLSF